MYITKQQLSTLINDNPDINPDEIVNGIINRGWVIEGLETKKPSFLQNVGREIAKPFVQGAELLGQGAKAYGQVLKAGGQAIRGNKQAAQQTLAAENERLMRERKSSIPLMGGEVPTIQSQKQAVGSALNLASNFVGGSGAVKAGTTALKTGLMSAVKTGVKTGVKAGTLYGAGEAMSEDRNVLGGAALGALGGGIAGGLLPLAGSAAVGTTKAIISPFSTAINKIAPKLDKLANKIETVAIKPSKSDIAHGFKVENIFKYDLGGKLGQSLEKTESKIGELVSKAESLRGRSKAVIDLNKIVKNVADDLDSASFSTVGNNQKILNAFKTWVSELEEIAPTGKISTIDAQKIKVALGKMGSWLNGQRDLDSTAMENVSNVFYTRMKTAIENAVDDPAELKAINQQLSELIPISNVLIKKIPIADRNSSLSLTDIVTAGIGTIDPKAWGLFALNRLSKSARFANFIAGQSRRLKSGATKLLPLETKLKDIKPGLTMEDITKKGNGEILKTTKSTDNLIQEAKKYKSAEEFIKAQETPIYHGTPEKFDTFNTNISEGNATWFSSSKDDILSGKAGAVQKAGQKLNIMERFVKPNIKLATPEMSDKMYSDQLIQEGYRGVRYPKGEYGDYEWTKLWFPNEDTITKSQLIDIWNKANKKTKLRK